MRVPRIFTSLPLQTDCQVELERESVHHLQQVLRMKSGAAVKLFNGDGRDYNGLLTDCTRKTVRISVTGRSNEEPFPILQINLGLGLSKGERMDFAIQKSVELGVTSITPLLTEHSVIRLSAVRLQNRREHWKRVAIAASEQSGRCRLADIGDALPLPEWLSKRETLNGTDIFLDHRANTTLDRLARTGSTVNLLIGPEGGLSPKDRNMAQSAGFIGIRLGPRVLRTETAPLAAISAIQVLWGDFREA